VSNDSIETAGVSTYGLKSSALPQLSSLFHRSLTKKLENLIELHYIKKKAASVWDGSLGMYLERTRTDLKVCPYTVLDLCRNRRDFDLLVLG